MHAQACTRTHMHAHAPAHAHTHTHTHTHTHSRSGEGGRGPEVQRRTAYTYQLVIPETHGSESCYKGPGKKQKSEGAPVLSLSGV